MPGFDLEGKRKRRRCEPGVAPDCVVASARLVSAAVSACRHCAAPVGAEKVRFCGQCGVAVGARGSRAIPGWGASSTGATASWTASGSGGMGVVYRVEHLQLGKFAAMKVLHPTRRASTGAGAALSRSRRRRSASSTTRTSSRPSTSGSGTARCTWSWSTSRARTWRAVLTREGPLPFARAAKLFVQVCSALTEAHEAGIIHRDLKPENLMVIERRDGTRARQGARLRPGQAARARRQPAAITLGRRRWSARPTTCRPSRCAASRSIRAPTSTAWARRCTACSPGVPPFQAPSPMGVLSKHLTDDVVPPRARAPELGLPPEADRIVLRAMAKSPADRYAVGRGGAAPISSAALAAAPRPRAAPVARRRRRAPRRRRPLDVRRRRRRHRARRPIRRSTTRRRSSADGGCGCGAATSTTSSARCARRGWLSRWLVPLILLAVVAGAARSCSATRLAASAPRRVEREPNNTPGYANLLPSDVPVRGSDRQAARRRRRPISTTSASRAGKGARAVSARLEGIPGRRSGAGAVRRAGAARRQERRARPRLGRVAAADRRSARRRRTCWCARSGSRGSRPTENVADPVHADGALGAAAAGWEVEPNDWKAAATPLRRARRCAATWAAPTTRTGSRSRRRPTGG